MKTQRRPDATTAEPMRARELRQRMQDAGLGTAELAARLDICQRKVQYMLSGDKRKGKIDYLIAFAVRQL